MDQFALVTTRARVDVARDMPKFAPNCHTWLSIDGAVDGYEDLETAIAAYPAEPLAEQPAGTFMLYSSGTTGRPKGILRALPETSIEEDSNLVGALQSMLWGFDESSVYLSPAPLYHSAPLGFTTGTQSLGGTVIMMPRFDPIGALAAIEEYRVTHSQWVPTMFSRMLKLDEDERSGFDLSSHRVAIHAAAPCPPRVKEQMFDWWGRIIYEYYGGTEVNGLTHTGPDEWFEHPGTVGKPVLGVLHICDEDGTELPTGEPGIVYFELPVMPFEYLKDPEKTREAQHPEHPNWSALGDVGYMDDDGFLYLTDRATHMIISGGVNIYPQEIEDAMIMHPKVVDVAVIGVPNEEMGEAVKAIVQPAPNATPGASLEAELLAYAREHIAHYKCPRPIQKSGVVSTGIGTAGIERSVFDPARGADDAVAWRGWSDDVRGVLWRGSNPGMPIGWLSVGIGVLRCGRAAHCEPWGMGRFRAVRRSGWRRGRPADGRRSGDWPGECT